MKHKIFQVDGNNDSEGEDPEETNIVPLVLVDFGASLVPSYVQVPCHQHKSGTRKDLRWQCFFISYYFQDYPKICVVTSGHNRGVHMPSIDNVFLI